MEKLLKELDACGSATEWAKGKSWKEVYDTCERGDWLLWLFKNTNPNDLRELTLVKGHCSKTVIHLMKDERSKKAVQSAIDFGNNKISKEQLAAADAAYAAYAYADYAYAAAYVAADAADATDAADAAAYAAYAAAYVAADAADAADATDAADAAAYAAYAAAAAAAAYVAAYAAAAADAARKENLKLTADICRKYLPIEIWNIDIK